MWNAHCVPTNLANPPNQSTSQNQLHQLEPQHLHPNFTVAYHLHQPTEPTNPLNHPPSAETHHPKPTRCSTSRALELRSLGRFLRRRWHRQVQTDAGHRRHGLGDQGMVPCFQGSNHGIARVYNMNFVGQIMTYNMFIGGYILPSLMIWLRLITTFIHWRLFLMPRFMQFLNFINVQPPRIPTQSC